MLSLTCKIVNLFIISYFVLFSQSFADPVYLHHVCSNKATFTPNGTFNSNLNYLLSNLSSQASQGEPFNRMVVGERNTAVYGSYLCYGSIANAAFCKDCVSFATKDMTRRCPIETEVIVWYDVCMLRYSNRSFFNTVAYRPGVALFSMGNVSAPDEFRKTLEMLMKESTRKVENEAKRFMTREIELVPFQKIYSLMQCMPDLSGGDCSSCLSKAIDRLSICCEGRQGGRVLCPSCNVRYEFYPFYDNESNPTVVLSPPISSPSSIESLPPLPPGRTANGMSKAIMVGITTTILLVFLAIGAFSYVFYCTKLRFKKSANIVPQENDITVESLQFTLVTIQIATRNFSIENKLGEGGFGEVYKGVLEEGRAIAVKRLSKYSGQGTKEFKNEVALVAKLQHRNLVRLLGFCLEEGEKILIYEFVPNKSLDYIIFDTDKQKLVDWQARCNIINGIARGILYLHEDSRLRVIHRDLKTSNVSLDEDLQPKIADFGMAKMVNVDQTQGKTKRIVGTYGYMAPEYAMEGLYSVKSDMFSFGVILLEILSGKKNSGFHLTKLSPSLLAYAWKLWNEGNCLELMDISLKDSFKPSEFIRYVHIGLLCVQEDANNRPTMSFVVLMLTSDTSSLPIPERPAFSIGKVENDYHPSEVSENSLTISAFDPR